MSSPNMNLPIPVPTVTDGPQYAIDEVGCFNKIDSHNHTSGQGVPVPVDGIQIDNNLPMNSFGLTSASSVGFQNQLSSPGSGKIYMSGNDLYWTNGTGAYNVQITTNGSVNAGAGSITGLPSGTASAAYISGSGTFQFRSATNTAADVDGRSVILRNSAVSSFGMTVAPPSAMSQDYTVTLPVPPAVTSFMTMDNAGAIAVVAPYPLGTNDIANLAVTTAKIDNSAVTTAKIADQNVTPVKRSPANYSAGNTGTVSFTATGTSTLVYSLTLATSAANKQMMVLLQPYLSGSNINCGTQVRLFLVVVDPAAASTVIRSVNVSGSGTPQFQALHVCPSVGTYTVQVRVEATGGSTGCNVVDYQLQLVEMG